MTTVLTLEECKERAQSARRRAKRIRQGHTPVGSLRESMPEFLAVRNDLDQIVAVLLSQFKQVSKDSITARWLLLEIGDCLGTLGGLMRHVNKHSDAADYYADGRQCEVRVKELGGVSNSYCLVQELVSRVLICPKDFWTGKDRKLFERIELARAEVRQQIELDRRRDPWAYADLALLTQIIRPQDATRLWYSLDEIKPYRLVYESTLPVLSLLFESLCATRPDYDFTSWQETSAFFRVKLALSAQRHEASLEAKHAFHEARA